MDDFESEGTRFDNEQLENTIADVSMLSRQATVNQRVIGQVSQDLDNMSKAIFDLQDKVKELERKHNDADTKIHKRKYNSLYLD